VNVEGNWVERLNAKLSLELGGKFSLSRVLRKLEIAPGKSSWKINV
jgi:hypothetical protein